MAYLHLIGNAHLDPVWLWRWQEGFSEILATFRSALDRMKEFPDFKFTSACAVYYEWVEKIDPAMFEEIRQRVAEGRWNIAGGWYLQPDCNIPDGESFARHALLAQRYFKEKFGVMAKTGYNVDSFGHNASLPQILKKSGMSNYVFMRPSEGETDIQEHVFRWKSPDGSEVTAFRIPKVYNIDLSRLEILHEIKEKAESENRDYMAFYGVGNHGGGPTIRLIDEMNKLDIPDMVYSTPDDYFEHLNKDGLPVIADELQHHARGCYSLGTFIKTNNRRCESSLLAAERFCVMAKRLVQADYPHKKLTKAWKNLLFNQFHDILGGCIIKSAYRDAGYLYGETMSITEQETHAALQKISGHIDTLQGESLPAYKTHDHWQMWQHEVLGTPVVVFNPHMWAVKAVVEVGGTVTKVTDCRNDEIPFQRVRGEQTNVEDKYKTAFLAEVAPYGYAVYRVFSEKPCEAAFQNELRTEQYALENSVIRVEFDRRTGDVCRFYDKKNGKELISKPCSAVVLDETESDAWAHNKVCLGVEIGSFDTPECSIIEEGPVRATMRVQTRYADSLLQRDYTITCGSDMVTVKTKVDFHEKHRVLKFCFPVMDAAVTAKIPFGAISRKTEKSEEPCGSWIAAGGLVVANDSKYGYDVLDGAVRLTVLRSAIYADHYGSRDALCEYMEQGVHECSYAIFPYKSNAHAQRRADELNIGVYTVLTGFHGGTLPQEGSYFHTDAENIIVTAVKEGEDGGDILRFYEADGKNSEMRLTLFDKEYKMDVAHNEIITLSSDGSVCNLLEYTEEEGCIPE